MSEPRPDDPEWPPPPEDLLPYVNNASRVAQFGDAIAHLRCDGSDPVPPGGRTYDFEENREWAREYIVAIEIPQLRDLGISCRKRVHKTVKDSILAIWQEWEDEGLLDKVRTVDGFYVHRFSKGSKPGEPNFRRFVSNHAFGTAFDVNARWNGIGKEPTLFPHQGSVRELVEVANKHGFFWGGHFARKKKDGMHFEFGRRIRNRQPVLTGESTLGTALTLGALANANGLLTRTVLEHQPNKEFSSGRRVGETVRGDSIQTPEVRSQELPIDTSAVARMQYGETLRIRVRFRRNGIPKRNNVCVLEGRDFYRECRTDTDGMIDETLPPGIRTLSATLDSGDGELDVIPLRVTNFASLETLSGVRDRLHNLGFPGCNVPEQLELSVAAFQREHDIPLTSEMEGKFFCELETAYGTNETHQGDMS